MAQFYVPRYDTGSGNPWASAASAYGNELDRLGSLQQQGMQQGSQLPMQLYQSFMQGYQDQQAQQQAQAEFDLRQQQIERQNRLADIAQQKADEAESYHRDQLKQQGVLKGTALLASTQRDMAENYTPTMRGSYKTQIAAALMSKGMGESEANAAAEGYLPQVTEQKYESKVQPDAAQAEGVPSDWGFKIGDQTISVPGKADKESPESWAFSPGSTAQDSFLGAKIIEAKRKEARDAQLAQQVALSEESKAARLEFEKQKEEGRQKIMLARIGQGATKADIAAQAKQDKEEAKRRDEKIDAKARHESLSATMNDLASLSQAIKDSPDLQNIQGYTGKLRAVVPGSRAYDMMADLKKLSSQSMIATIERMKAQSKTGATGFGQLSNQEGEILRSALANLDTLQSTEALKKNLNAIITTARSAIARSQSAIDSKYGDKQGRTEVKRQRGTGSDAGKIKIIYSDGTEEIIQGGQ